MAEPKKKRSATRSGNNRSHLNELLMHQRSQVVLCDHCRTPNKAHTVCGNCGYYKGSLVLPQKAKS